VQLAYLNFTAVVGLAAHEAARELGITFQDDDVRRRGGRLSAPPGGGRPAVS
jgi:hypothetical protein